MAQAKLNDYFTSKKRTDVAQAAKRRKLEIPFTATEFKRSNRTRSTSDDGKKSPATNPLVPSDSESDVERDGVSATGELSFSLQKDTRSSIKSADVVSAMKSCRNKYGTRSQFPTSRNKGKTKTASSVRSETGQKKLTDLLIKSSSKLPSPSDSDVDSGSKSAGSTDSDKALKNEVNIEQQTIITEEITSFWDNHDTVEQNTPRKRIINIEDIVSDGLQSRKRKVPIRKQSPSKMQDLVTVSVSVKKKLDLLPSEDPGPSKTEEDPLAGDSDDDEVNAVMTGKSRLLALVSEIIIPLDHAVSPLPATPERPQEESSSPEPIIPITPKLQNLSQKLKALSKMNGQALKNRLKQSGKIYDIKEKLGELDKAIKEGKSQGAPVQNPVLEDTEKEQSEKILPAYQRFEHLVEEGPPTLSLPFSYRILEGAFEAMDTVVSMMHNRSEMCTFSKLKVAVQNMTKKNFEEKTIGQIKTIVPDAYIFRQENNIPTFGRKVSGYQLTVEANLKEDLRNTEGPKTGDGRPTFTATALLKRKRYFKNNLLIYLKQLHRTFLASLNQPLSVPDDKLTRWHPRFQLDKVPEVVSAPLPQPPDVKVYHSAKDVLEKQRGKLNPRVEEALSRVVAEKEDENIKNLLSSQSSLSSSLSSTSSSTSSSSEQNKASLKGIPPALLAKIRAKEAQKMEEALTRSPAEDNKTRIMSHLPEIIKILRTYFVTEKKPALPLETVYKKLEESYRTGISQRDIEQHMDMLKELAPELISVVEIKRGKYLKLDKNVDVQAVSNRILNLVKSRK